MVVVPGGKPVMFFALLALAQAGDEVVVPRPRLPDLRVDGPLRRARSRSPTRSPEEHDFRVDLDELEGLVTERTRLLIINSPANPTGGVFTRSDIERVADLVLAHPE